MIRAALFRNFKKELPYCCEVQVNEFKDRGDVIAIKADIMVERDSQKGIVIGKGGQGIKRVRVDAQQEMQEFFQAKVSFVERVCERGVALLLRILTHKQPTCSML